MEDYMFKSKKIIALMIITILSISQISSFAAVAPNVSKSGFEEYCSLQNSNKISAKSIKKDFNSDDYIKYLTEKGIKFEVTDKYYSNSGKIVGTISSKNIEPKRLVKAGLVTRAREVKEYSSREQVDQVADTAKNLVTYVIGILAEKAHPAIAFINNVGSIFGIKKEDMGDTRIVTYNYYIYNNVWHEVNSTYGYIPMVITQSRRTNLDVYTAITNKKNNRTESTTQAYNNVCNEYSMYYGNIVRNLQEAENRYNAGLRDPEIYNYNSGTIVHNLVTLPK